jgi:hypothetical protein
MSFSRDQKFCGKCGKPCEVITIDDGIGSHEFWGSVSIHHDYITVSDCCESEQYFDEIEAFEELGDSHLQIDLKL